MGRPTRSSRKTDEESLKEESPKKAEPTRKAVAPKKAIKAKEEAAERKKEDAAKKAADADTEMTDADADSVSVTASTDHKDKEEDDETEDEHTHTSEKDQQESDDRDNKLEQPQKEDEKASSPKKPGTKVTNKNNNDETQESKAETHEPATVKDEPTKVEPSKQESKEEEMNQPETTLPSEETNQLDHKETTQKKEESEEVKDLEVIKEAEDSKPEEDDPNAIWQPTDFDVLSGRGASVNSHGGNKKFRALCFARKPEFEAGNHAAKRRIATEIVNAVLNDGEARFLKRKNEKGPWLELTKEQAILKACQVMRDYKRPDRLALREMLAQNGQARKRSRQVESTPMLDIPIPSGPLEPIIENPFGVHDHDILCGRGAFVNGHIGNQRLRKLALERKAAFDAGNYTEKRSLANEIVTILKALDPPGRFLKRASKKSDDGTADGDDRKDDEPKEEGEWEELNDEKSIHKACQVMRDIDRPDRKDREERRAKKKQKMMEAKTGKVSETKEEEETVDVKKEEQITEEEKKSVIGLEDGAVEEAVAATEAALDKVLDAAGTKEEGESVEV